MDSDLYRDRMTVEAEKMERKFPSFDFYVAYGQVTLVRGYLSTSYGNEYYVKIAIPERYPYTLPKIYLPYHTIERGCPHTFSDGNICVMRSDQWTSSLSLAFLVAKTALWLNKYDSWKRGGRRRWPGKGQPH